MKMSREAKEKLRRLIREALAPERQDLINAIKELSYDYGIEDVLELHLIAKHNASNMNHLSTDQLQQIWNYLRATAYFRAGARANTVIKFTKR